MKKIILLFYTFILMMTPSTHTKDITNEKLKILFTTTYFPATDGRFILNMITGCIDEGHDVSIYAKLQGPKITHEHVRKYNLLDRTYYRHVPNLERFDIVFSQFGYRGQDFAQLLKEIPQHKRPKLVTCFRGADITKFVKNNPNRYNELFKIGTLFLPVCDYFSSLLIKLGCDPKKITVLHAAIDCEAFAFHPPVINKNNQYNVVSVSRLVEKKGIQDAIQAIYMVKDEYPNIHYYIVGDGKTRGNLEELVKNLHLQKHVTFLGRLQEKDIIKLLRKCHLFVLPSITAKDGDQEGIPNAVKEAMSCGLPVIVTDHAGNKELVIEGSGFIVQEHDVEAIAEKIVHLIQHPEIWKPMGTIGRKHVLEHFEMHSTNQKLIRLFENIMKKPSNN